MSEAGYCQEIVRRAPGCESRNRLMEPARSERSLATRREKLPLLSLVNARIEWFAEPAAMLY